MLTRDQLMTAGATPSHEDIETPAGIVRVGVMTGVERHQWDTVVGNSVDSDSVDADTPKLQATLICLTATEESGKRMFTLDDVDAVSVWKTTLIDPLYKAAWRINMLGVKALENESKN